MTQLTVRENKAIAALPVQVQPIVTARFGKPIKNYENWELAKAISDMILRSNFEMGHNKITESDTVLSQQREILLRDFRAVKYESLSFELIQLFISSGIRGEYGAFKGQINTVNIQNIHHWVKSGLESENYKRSVTEFNRKLDQEVKTSKEPVYYSPQNLTVMCRQAFEDYKKDQSLPIPGASAVFYEHIKNTLKADTLIDLLDWEDIQNEAKRWYLAQLKEARSKKDTSEIKPDYTLPDKNGNGGNIAYGFHVKRIALKYYFDQLIKENKNLDLTTP